MFKHILVPTDGSELSNGAVEYAVALAKAVNAKLTALTVTAPYRLAVAPELMAVEMEGYLKNNAKLAAQNLDAAKNIASTAQVRCEVVQAEHPQPYLAIIETAKERDCDLIVMASHGRRGVAAMVLGSETVKVLTHSAIPVLVVRPKVHPLAFLKGP